MQLSSAKPDFYNDKAAHDKFLKEVLDRLYQDLNREVIENSGINFVDTRLVANDTANIQFIEKDRNYNGRSYRGIQIYIKREQQTTVGSGKFPFGC